VIIPLLLAGALHIVPVKDAVSGKDTVWWRTDGGNVVEHQTKSTATCSLWLIDKDGSLAFTWERGKPITVSVITPALATSETMSQLHVTMQIGGTWVKDHQPLDAVGFGTNVNFVIDDRSIEDQLRVADSIAIRTDKSEFLMYLPRDKMTALVGHVKQCRDSVPGWGSHVEDRR
jgi:hypothetical protein